MRFAGDLIQQGNPQDIISPQSADEVYRFQYNKRNKPVVPGFNSEDLAPTPELTPRGPQFPGLDLLKDQYIKQNPGSGVAMLPNGVQGPSQGPNTPIKNYGGRYMPDGTQPSGYRPGPRRV